NIQCRLVNNVTFKAPQKTWTRRLGLLNIEFDGLPAGASALGPQAKYYEFQLVNKSRGDGFIGPSTDGLIVESLHFIEVESLMDGCLCCSDTPKVSIPVQIIPAELPKPNIQPPPNWQPQVMPPVTITININMVP